MSDASAAALPYEEPGIVTILILAGFLLALNIVNYIFDAILTCGLIGQIFIGIAWGTPGAKLLGHAAETTIVNLGYLGLLLLVYEGGLSTSWSSLKANGALSIAVALTGICLPIGLSFVLILLAGATALQAFAAGAALCSTSLGTTFTVLSSNCLRKTRMSVVLTTAAMLDDVIGLVMVQVISNLGVGSSFSYATVVRPVFVAIAFLIAILIVCHLVIRRLALYVGKVRARSGLTLVGKALERREAAFLVQTSLLLSMVTAASYAGTSNLFAAYLSGAMVTWWDSQGTEHRPEKSTRPDDRSTARNISLEDLSRPAPSSKPSKTQPSNSQSISAMLDASTEDSSSAQGNLDRQVFEAYYAQPLKYILQPFFFASIGFSVPITKLFDGSTVWRGLVYAVLMFVGKVACGLWLVRLPTIRIWNGRRNAQTDNKVGPKARKNCKQSTNVATAAPESPHSPATVQQRHSNEGRKIKPSTGTKPISLYPACILGCAMTARGEIGFLISAVAQSRGIFPQSAGTEDSISLIVTWAILLCTILGPLCVGFLTKRLRRLEKAKSLSTGSANSPQHWTVLGKWGVE